MRFDAFFLKLNKCWDELHAVNLVDSHLFKTFLSYLLDFLKLKKIFRQLNNLMSITKNHINVRITETRIHICLFIIKNDITSIMVIYNTVYYLLSGSDFNGQKFNFIKCTVYSKCQKKYKKTKYYVNFSAKNVQKCRNLHFYQTVQTFQNDHLMYMYEIV